MTGLAGVRELLTEGMLFSDAMQVFGTDFSIRILPFNMPFFANVAGALILTGVLIALIRRIGNADESLASR